MEKREHLLVLDNLSDKIMKYGVRKRLAHVLSKGDKSINIIYICLVREGGWFHFSMVKYAQLKHRNPVGLCSHMPTC